MQPSPETIKLDRPCLIKALKRCTSGSQTLCRGGDGKEPASSQVRMARSSWPAPSKGQMNSGQRSS